MCYRIYKGQYQSAEEMAIHVYGCIKQYLILERALEGKEHLVSKTIQVATLYTCDRLNLVSTNITTNEVCEGILYCIKSL